MTLRLVWSVKARLGLRDILDYIAEQDEGAASRLSSRIDTMLLSVLEHPFVFRPGRVDGTREMVVHPNYILVYRVTLEHIEIVRVLHTRREYP